jgi:hypothetical protein
MDPRVREIIILCLISGVVCGIAFEYDYTFIGSLFAGITATTGLLALALKTFS